MTTEEDGHGRQQTTCSAERIEGQYYGVCDHYGKNCNATANAAGIHCGAHCCISGASKETKYLDSVAIASQVQANSWRE